MFQIRKSQPGSVEKLVHGQAVEEGLNPSHLTPQPAPSRGPQCLWPQGPVLRKTIFPQTRVGGGLGMIQARHIYCALYFLLLHQLLLRSSGIRIIGQGCCSVAKPRPAFRTPWPAARHASLPLATSWSWLTLLSTEAATLCNRFIVCHFTLLSTEEAMLRNGFIICRLLVFSPSLRRLGPLFSTMMPRLVNVLPDGGSPLNLLDNLGEFSQAGHQCC